MAPKGKKNEKKNEKKNDVAGTEASVEVSAESVTSEPAAPEATPSADAPKKRQGRPAGTKARKYGASPAGHFADLLVLMQSRVGKIAGKAGKWNADVASNLATAGATLQAAAMALQTMAAENFKPVRAHGGVPAKTFRPGQSVKVNDDGMALLKLDFPQLTNDHEIVIADTYTDGGKAAPLMVLGGASPMYIGRVSIKFLIDATPAAA